MQSLIRLLSSHRQGGYTYDGGLPAKKLTCYPVLFSLKLDRFGVLLIDVGVIAGWIGSGRGRGLRQ
jgi:hypothetical protein